jgi:hemerythrin
MNAAHSSNDLVTWSNDLSLGLDEVDDQHLYLVERINKLWHALLENRDREVVQEIIEELYSYTQTHFIAEEVLMRSFDYPKLPEHQRSHRMFTDHIRKAADDYSDGKPISMDLLHFLNDWLQKHIKVTDRDYANYIDRKKHGRLLGGFKSLFGKFNKMASHDSDDELTEDSLQGLDMNRAIHVHVSWIKRLEQALEKQSPALDVGEIADHQRCMLGNWISANQDKGLHKLPEFERLIEHHIEFHTCAASIARKHAEGNTQTALMVLKRDLRHLSNAIRFDIIQLYGAHHRKFE